MIIFQSTDDRFGECCQLETGAEQLTDVLEAFERFLRGAGYHFDGKVTIVDEPFPIIKDPNQ